MKKQEKTDKSLKHIADILYCLYSGTEVSTSMFNNAETSHTYLLMTYGSKTKKIDNGIPKSSITGTPIKITLSTGV